MVHTDKHIMDVTLDDLYANYRKKSCQDGCGVYCAVSASLVVEKPIAVLGKEIVARARRIPSMFDHRLTPAFRQRGVGATTNPNGTPEMNGRSNGSPAANQREASRKNV